MDESTDSKEYGLDLFHLAIEQTETLDNATPGTTTPKTTAPDSGGREGRQVGQDRGGQNLVSESVVPTGRRRNARFVKVV